MQSELFLLRLVMQQFWPSRSGVSIFSAYVYKVLMSIANKRWNKDKLAARLEEATNIVKSVYRSAVSFPGKFCILTTSYSELPSHDLVVPALLKSGIQKLRDTCKLTPGIPLKPMLAKPTKAIGEVLDRFEGKKFTCEYKYDGERAQVCSSLPPPKCSETTPISGPSIRGWHNWHFQSEFGGHE